MALGCRLAQPNEDAIRLLTRNVLKDSKGWGRAAELIERCTREELPKSITGFLEPLFGRFPKPKAASPERETDAPDAPSAAPLEAEGAEL